jgi:hypothetical protein
MADELYMREALRCLEWWAFWCVLLVVPVVVLTLQLWYVDIRLMIRGWLWAEWMRWNIMFALVQHFRLPPPPPFSFKQYHFRGHEALVEEKDQYLRCSKDLEDLQQCWWTNIHDERRALMKSREFCSVGDGARWNTYVLRVFLFSHVQDALPRASPLFMWTTLHLPRFIIPTVRSRRSQALSQHYEDSMTVLSPESSFRRALQMIFNSLRWFTNTPCSKDDWCPPIGVSLSSTFCHLDVPIAGLRV